MSDHAAAPSRRRLFPDDVEPVQLYRSEERLAAAVERCIGAGWKAVDLDASGWTAADRLHNDIAAALSFPDYYGRNLDALVDQLQSLPSSSGPAFASAGGLVITVRRIDALVATDPLLASDVIEIFADAAHHGLRYGWPVAVLLQSGDPGIELAPMAARVIPWNRAERDPADRA